MQNVQISTKANVITITIDTDLTLGDSKSGKTVLIATTGGNQAIALPDGRQIKLGVNCFQSK
jgi:hypothetical protein